MAGKYKVITLCGSTMFKDDFLRQQKRLTLEGNIVLSVGFFEITEDDKLDDDKLKLIKDIHMKKIDMADEIFVINKGGYIGSSTKSEIDYALKNGKIVNYLEN